MGNRGDGKPGEGECPDSLEPPSAAALTGYNLFRTIRAHKLNKKPHTELKAAGRTSSYLYYITSVKRGTLLHLLVGHTSTQSHSCLASKRASSFLTPAKTNQEHTYFSLVSTPGVVFIQDFNKNLSRDVTSIAITKVKHQPNLSSRHETAITGIHLKRSQGKDKTPNPRQFDPNQPYSHYEPSWAQS
ncbi:hypothetical protein SMACR_08013 [Sordaria macrospora]|uniref:Uncharacterized protein n=1 Tax=Sordaria macrospora TaxID=5147 RepID=A0A8S8ZPD1_SORMA|nr:hypothetical protein SMACR_08013 [Sordaria macrospora]WPJ62903.1 hypothetical protein SMAC4_08013 [Sordaria macrospora]